MNASRPSPPCCLLCYRSVGLQSYIPIILVLQSLLEQIGLLEGHGTRTRDAVVVSSCIMLLGPETIQRGFVYKNATLQVRYPADVTAR